MPSSGDRGAPDVIAFSAARAWASACSAVTVMKAFSSGSSRSIRSSVWRVSSTGLISLSVTNLDASSKDKAHVSKSASEVGAPSPPSPPWSSHAAATAMIPAAASTLRRETFHCESTIVSLSRPRCARNHWSLSTQ